MIESGSPAALDLHHRVLPTRAAPPATGEQETTAGAPPQLQRALHRAGAARSARLTAACGREPPGEVRQPRGELHLCSARPQPAQGAPAAAHSCRRSAQPHEGAPPPASPAQLRMGPPLSARRALAAALPGRHPPIRTWDRHRPCGELVQACVGLAGGGKAPERIRQQGQYCHFTSLSQLK